MKPDSTSQQRKPPEVQQLQVMRTTRDRRRDDKTERTEHKLATQLHTVGFPLVRNTFQPPCRKGGADNCSSPVQLQFCKKQGCHKKAFECPRTAFRTQNLVTCATDSHPPRNKLRQTGGRSPLYLDEPNVNVCASNWISFWVALLVHVTVWLSAVRLIAVQRSLHFTSFALAFTLKF